jgi:chaperone modulatory protein CbpM
MITVQEFLLRVRVEHRSLEAWIAAGWLIPPQTEPELMFNDVDLARAQLIRDLREDFGVNDEGVSVILHLIDQMHGLRRSMRDLLDELHSRGAMKRK